MKKLKLIILSTLLITATAYAQWYVKINSNGGEPLCPVTGSHCNPPAGLSENVQRAVRALAMTRHPNGGLNYWTCGSSASEGNCKHGSERVFLIFCNTSGPNPGVCLFGSNGVTEGSVGIDPLGQNASYLFYNGGYGQANFSGQSFNYTGP